jgi:hypothetical protein
MSRITLGEFKKAVRDPSLRRGQGGAPTIPTPFPVAESAVRRFHANGATSAQAYLNATFDRSDYWGAGGHGAGWADAIRECFDNYVEMASPDQRPRVDIRISEDAVLGVNTVGVHLDVVLLDDRGYVGRFLLWDVPELNAETAQALAAPITVALGMAFGASRVVEVEFWHLRTATAVVVPANEALGAIDEASTTVARYLSE